MKPIHVKKIIDLIFVGNFSKMSQCLGYSRTHIYNVVNGERNITPDLTYKFNDLLLTHRLKLDKLIEEIKEDE